jgi:hypothetical protein
VCRPGLTIRPCDAQAATAEQIASYTVQASHAGMHSAGKPGILCVDVSPRDDHVVGISTAPLLR